MLALQLEKRPSVGDGARDLETIAHDIGIREQPLDLARIETRDLRRIESGERLAIAFAFFENRGPREPSLGALERQELEEQVIIVHGHAPFGVVVGDLERTGFGPGAACDGGRHGRALVENARSV